MLAPMVPSPTKPITSLAILSSPDCWFFDARSCRLRQFVHGVAHRKVPAFRAIDAVLGLINDTNRLEAGQWRNG